MFVYTVHMEWIDGGNMFGAGFEAENPDNAMERAEKMFSGFAKVISVDIVPTCRLEIEEVR